MNRKQWNTLWRSVRRGDVNTAYLVRNHGMGGATMSAKGKRFVHRLATWNAAKALLDILMTDRARMAKTDRRAILAAVRSMTGA